MGCWTLIAVLINTNALASHTIGGAPIKYTWNKGPNVCFMAICIAAEKANAGLRHSVVCMLER